MEDLDAATLEDVHAFFRAHYGPNNTVLTLVGDVTPEEGFAAVERYFGDLPATSRAAPRATTRSSTARGPARLDRREDVPNDRLYVSFRLPVDTTPDYLACQVAVDVLGGLASSRLVRRLVRTDETAVAVGGWTWASSTARRSGTITVDVSAGPDVDEVEAAVCEEIERLRRARARPRELEAVIADTERSWLRALASIEERADHISHHALLTGDPDIRQHLRRPHPRRDRRAGARRRAPRGSTRSAGPSSLPVADGRADDAEPRAPPRTSHDRPPAPSSPRPSPGRSPRPTYDLPNGLRLLAYDVPASTSSRCASACPCRCATSRASGGRRLDHGAHPRRGHREPTAEEFAGLLERKGVASVRAWPTPACSSTSTSSRATSSRRCDLLARSSPSRPSPTRGRPSGPHPARRDRAGALDRRAPRRDSSSSARSTRPTTGRPAHRRHAARRCRRSPARTSRPSTPSTSSPPA